MITNIFPRRFSGLFILALAPSLAHANFAWPPLFYIHTYGIWWVVLSGLLIEGLVYLKFFNLAPKRVVQITLVMNIGSAIGGAAFSYGSLAVVYMEFLVLPFLYISAPLIFAMTVAIEYLVAIKIFGISKTKRTLLIIGLANVPSVSIAIWQTMELTGKALSG